MARSRGRAFVALAAAGSLWGTGFLFGKWALAELSVGQMVLYRFLFASLGFAPAVWRGRGRNWTWDGPYTFVNGDHDDEED